MNELNDQEKIKRLEVLNDIYSKENERLKYEYRVLHDKYEEKNRECEQIKDSCCKHNVSMVRRAINKLKRFAHRIRGK